MTTYRIGTSRRRFVTTVSVATAGLLSPRRVWAAPASVPLASDDPPQTAAQAETRIAASPVVADEPTAQIAIDAAVDLGASYADVRLVRYRVESIQVRDGYIRGIRRDDHYGIGLRVIASGGWGFAATSDVRSDSARLLATQAVDAAKRNGTLRRSLDAQPIQLVPNPVSSGDWVAPHDIAPFDVSVADKAELLIDASQRVLSHSRVSHSDAGVDIVEEDKLFLSSEGARYHQIIPRMKPSLSATAVDRKIGRFASRELEVAACQAGWEYAESLQLGDHAERVASQVLQKLYADPVSPGVRHVVLAPSNLWLTIHESIGHPTELDRAMGLEADYAGTSFIKPQDQGRLRLGSEHVHLVADRTQRGGLATVGWDDDGVRPHRWDIVRDGMFVGWQTTRDQAAWIGEASSRGCSYAQGFEHVAFQRMPNISLQPGAEGYTTEDLINATEDGILVTGRGSYSIDQQRYNFQFSGQMFWEIKRGRLTKPLRNVAYQANTVEFWRSCDMVGGEGTYRLHGTFFDGKGQPPQVNAVSHGCPPARFKANVINTGSEA